MTDEVARFSPEELGAEAGTLLPAKEVLSLLDLNVDVNLALDLVAPIDLAVAGNLNVAAPINGAVSANVLSVLSTSGAHSTQGVMLDQILTGQAIAHAPQTAVVAQSAGVGNTTTTPPPATAPTPAPQQPAAAPAATTDATTGSLLDGDLLNINAKISVDANLAAPIAGAVALNANAAAPIDASVSANVGSVGSQSAAVTDQQAIIHQTMDGVLAKAISAQDAQISQ
jgi:hypothetical protein